MLALEQGGILVLEQSEVGIMRLRQEGAPYAFLLLEDYSGDILLEEQPAVNVGVR